jgi:hypothetical protein
MNKNVHTQLPSQFILRQHSSDRFHSSAMNVRWAVLMTPMMTAMLFGNFA